MIADAIEKDVVTALKAIQGFLPRESKVDLQVQENSLVGVLSAMNQEIRLNDEEQVETRDPEAHGAARH